MAERSAEGAPSKLKVELPSDREIRLVRSFRAPRALVFEVMTKAEHLAHWYGPRSMSLVSCELDARVGGSFRYVIRDAGGTPHTFRGAIRELVAPSKVVYVEVYSNPDFTSPEALVTSTFEEHDGWTTLSVRTLYPSKEIRDAVLGTGMEQGAGESYDRLDALLEEQPRSITMTRTVRAPRELVFEVFTSPNHVDQWWGPRGFTNTTYSMDVRPGGTWVYDMNHAEHGKFPNCIRYREVTPPARLVYDHGETVDGPPHFHVVTTFEPRGEKATQVTMRLVFPTAEARDTVVRDFGAIEGGNQTLDKLAEHVEKLTG